MNPELPKFKDSLEPKFSEGMRFRKEVMNFREEVKWEKKVLVRIPGKIFSKSKHINEPCFVAFADPPGVNTAIVADFAVHGQG